MIDIFQPAIHVTPSRFVTIPLAATMTGYTPSAMRTKITRGYWVEGREYVRAPDGHVLIDMRGYERWVSQGKGPQSPT